MADIQHIDIGKRLDEFLSFKKITPYEFANTVGTSRQNIYNAIKKGDFKFSIFLLMDKKFPEIVNFFGVGNSGLKTDYKEPGENGILNEPQQEYQKTQKTQQYKIENEGLINESDLHSQIADLKKQLAKKDEIILMLSTAIANVTKEDEVGERGYDNSDLKEIANEKLIRIAELKKEKGIE